MDPLRSNLLFVSVGFGRLGLHLFPGLVAHLSHTMTEQNPFDIEITRMGDHTFLYIQDQAGGRLLPVAEILSIVPNFRVGGSMIFLRGVTKAIGVDQPPEEIFETLKEYYNEQPSTKTK